MARLAELRCEHGRLPHLALLDLAVPDDAADARYDVRQDSSSMNPAIASTWIPDTAMAGA